ncbi:DUF4349 domain-containing protein [Mucilaginibacter calamicampi]|uniref:DUF4349 domain-containing protein n=1 Tax=Mucilaginibacter calamicampi TaxID=1302352 RepID=A0ABW2YRG8_9SPHI
MKAKLLVMLAGIAMLAACKGYEEKAAMDIDSLMQDTMLVKTADMQLKVKNVQLAAEKISKLVSQKEGMVMHHNMRSEIVSSREIKLSDDSIKKLTVFNTYADMTVKVPSNFIEAFMDSINHLSTYVDTRTMDVEDHTIDYVAEVLKTNNREKSVKLREKIKPTTNTTADSILAVADNIVDRKVANLRTEQAANYSTLTLKLSENNIVKAEVLANEDLSTYSLPLTKRIGLALSTGWFYFTEFVIGVLHLWPFIIAIAAVTYGVIVFRKKKAAKQVSA